MTRGILYANFKIVDDQGLIMAEDIWSKMLKPYTVQPTAASAIAFKATKVFP